MKNGFYEELVNLLLEEELKTAEQNTFIKRENLGNPESPDVLSMYLARHLHKVLCSFSGDNSLQKQIQLCNKIIDLIHSEQADSDGEHLKINPESVKILHAVISKMNFSHSNFDSYIKECTPVSGLSHCELFTGSNSGISLESEIKKEIRSSDRVSLIVSFVKYSGIRILAEDLEEFTKNGGELKVITTSYMGATDLKAVEYLSGLPNTQIKVSYNTRNERLHAKAWLFLRDTGFHTAYIGSSNISRSALTSGLEWNSKLTSRDGSIIIDKFRKTFDTYWEDKEFELFDRETDRENLARALTTERMATKPEALYHFDFRPYPFQEEILEKLEAERKIHKHNRNLVVAATGTGKTMISAFDFKRFKSRNPNARLLFVGHRKEILEQAMHSFRAGLKDNNFGELWLSGYEPESMENLFVSIPTLNNRLDGINLSSDFFNFIVVDEVHHIAAKSYRPLLNYFQPEILLGLTATPERNDNEDILIDFSHKIAAEIRLPEAMSKKLLCPFQYFGISDEVDLSAVSWRQGRYMVSEMEKLYTENDRRVRDIVNNIKRYLTDENDVRALGFCVSQNHARFMAEKFSMMGFKADYLVSENNERRTELRKKLLGKEINYLFVVDIFNEGVDLPEIDTVLFLRPTESLTIFLQQLGRGLRLADNKECLTVLDFVGNARPEYDFAGKFRALIGKSDAPIKNEIEKNFPHLPLGCSIVLEKKARKHILDNIEKATRQDINQLCNKIRNFRHQTNQELNLKNFLNFNHLTIELIYKKKYSWTSLCRRAEVIEDYSADHEKDIVRAIKRWLTTRSLSYFHFIRKLALKDFKINPDSLSVEEINMCLMLHYDVWNKAGGFPDLQSSLAKTGENRLLNDEMISVLDILIESIDYMEEDLVLPYTQPLKLHSRYHRHQIFAAFGQHTYSKASTNREGVSENKTLNTELLFIDLNKSEKDFSSSTLYNDFAIDEHLFHWQSQNSAGPETPKGLSYRKQKENGKIILLFIRESKKDSNGNTPGFVFAGKAEYVSTYGTKPMNITWKLEKALPPFIWKDSAKLAVG